MVVADPVPGAQLSQSSYGKPAADAIQMLCNIQTYRQACGITTNGNTTFMDIANISFVYNKIGNAGESDLIIEMSMSGYVAVVAASIAAGVNVSGSPAGDYALTQLFYNAASQHMTLPTGWGRISGVPNGDVTIKGRFARVGASGNVQTDNGDFFNMKVSERPL